MKISLSAQRKGVRSKRPIAFLLIFVFLTLIIVPSASAFDNTTAFNAGDTIKTSIFVKPEMLTTIQEEGAICIDLFYDDLVLKLDSHGWDSSFMPDDIGVEWEDYMEIISIPDRQPAQYAPGDIRDRAGISYLWMTFSGVFPNAVAGGKVFEAEFTALSDGNIGDADFYFMESDYYTFEVTVGDGSAGGSTSTYTISATSATAQVDEGDGFDISIVWSKDGEAENPASAMGLLNYDANLVAPGSLPDGVSQNGAGQLKFSSLGMSDNNIVSIPFNAVAAGDAEFNVSGNDGFALAVSLSGETDTIDAVAGEDLTITINPSVQVLFDATFKGLPSGYTLLKYKVDAKPTDTIYKYDGNEMHYVSIDGGHYMTWIVADTVGTDAAKLLITSSSGTPTVNIGDTNGDGKLQIVDAQIAYDIANSHTNYTSDSAFSHLSIAARLMADVNGDGQVTTADAQAIQYKLHNGIFPWEI